jgi:hypothetical protein
MTVGNRFGGTVSVYLGSCQYDFGGFLEPINTDGSSVFRLGSTVPVKFRLANCDGAPIDGAVARIFAAMVSGGIAGTEQEATSTSAADSGNTFRSAGSGQYVFNWGTRGLAQGTWQIRAVLDDGTSHTVLVSLASR